MDDEGIKWLVGILGIALLATLGGLKGCEIDRKFHRDMVAAGYCQTMATGYNSPIWRKCDCDE